MKKTNCLRKKTNRSNFDENENATIIKLISLKESNYSLKDYSYIKFSSGDEIELSELKKNKSQLIKLNIDSDKIYVVDKIELRNEKGDVTQTFFLPIYIKKCNSCYISLKQKKNGYCFEFIFYSKDKKIIDKYILSPNKKNKKNNFEIFDNYDLKHRKKINFINVDKEFANDYLNELTLDNKSYKICSIIKKSGEISSSIQELKEDKILPSKKSEFKANRSDINNIYGFFNEFIKAQNLVFLQNKYKSLKDEKVFKIFVNNYIYVNEIYSDIPEVTENDISILKEYLLKLILQHFFIDLSEMKATTLRKKEINDMILLIIDNFTSLIKDIENFAKKFDNPIIYKYRLFRSTLYNVYSITKSYKDTFLCLKILSNYKQKIMNLKNLSKNNPFYQAIEFMKNIAQKLNEDSCLFDLLLQYNSGISNDFDLLRIKGNKSKDNNTKYELSMITVKELVEHLQKIIPDFIIRYTCDDQTYAFYSSLNDIIFFNDKKTFMRDNIEDISGYDDLTLPIVILLIHECWGHSKVSLSNEIIKTSPTRRYLINNDFEEDEIIFRNDKTGEVRGESGFELEYLLTGIRNDSILSNFLLNVSSVDKSDLLNVNLWIQPSFEEFQNILKTKIEKAFKCNYVELLRKNRENKSDNNQNRYVEGTIIEDGIKIELFKV